MTFQVKVITGIAAACVILLVVAVLSHVTATQNEEDMRWVTHTHLVIEGLRQVQSSIADAETNQRGYLLTGDESDLIEYQKYSDRLREQLGVVRSLTSDNPTQQDALNHLDGLVKDKWALLDERIRIRKAGGLRPAAAAVQERPGKPLMREIEDLLSGMEAEEEKLLALRSRQLVASSRRTRFVTIGGNGLSLLFLSAAGFVIYQEMKRRAAAELAVRAINRELEERVAARTAELAERAKDLERSNTELQQFAYVASHDLQEPLRTISSFTQLLAKRYRDKLDGKAHEFIDFAVDGCKRMQAQINDLLSFSRVGTQGKPLLPVACDSALDRVLKTLKIAIEESNAVITRDPLPVVLADETQLCQVFQNLIGNALKFKGAEVPRVHISAAADPGGWKISVRDNGIGIAPEHRERLFVIFQRLHTKAQYPGTGIGLAICKKITERHGGRIWFEPAPGGGTTFLFTIHAPQLSSSQTGGKNELRLITSAH